MPKRALVFQHMHDDDLCYFDELLSADGFAIDTVHLYEGAEVPDLAPYDLMMVLGGAMDVWQKDDHPWLAAEEQAIAEWVKVRGKPFIGICLGHQLLASSLGGSVSRAAQGEVGLHRMTIDAECRHPFFAGLAGTLPVMQWHYAEVTELPPGGRLLASSPAANIQAFAIGEHALGVQFHFEWTLERIRTWPPDWLNALHRGLGEGAHARVIAEATPHMADINAMARRIYTNFKRTTGL